MPANVGTHGCDGDKLGEFWSSCPYWYTKEEMWLVKIIMAATEEAEVDAVKIGEIHATDVTGKNDPMEVFLEEYRQWKTDNHSQDVSIYWCSYWAKE